MTVQDERAPSVVTRTYRRLSQRRGRWPFVLAIVALFVLVLIPLVYLLMMSLRDGRPGNLGDWTLESYQIGLSNELTYEALRNTIGVALVGTAISLTLAVAFAWLIERTDMPFRNLAFTVLVLPIALPSILFVLAWTILLAPRSGLVNVAIRDVFAITAQGAEGPFDIYTLGGVIFLDAMRGVTTIFLMLAAGFRLFDPSLEEAAKVSGAGVFATIRRVTLPALLPAILAAAIYSFISSLDQFEAALAAGLPGNVFLLPTLIFFTVQFRQPIDYSLGAVYSVIFMVIMIVLLLLYRRVVRRSERFATVSGKGYRPERIKLGKWRYPAFGLVAAYGIVAVVLPAVTLLWLSLRPPFSKIALGAGVPFTLEVYSDLFGDPQMWHVLWNTVKMMVSTATVTMVIAFLVSWSVIRGTGRIRGFLDGMSFLPYAFPGITIALSMIIVFLNPPGNAIPIYGTVTILVIALTIQYLAFSTRLMNGAIVQVKAELEEAGRVSGAQYLSVLRRITVPLLVPALMSGWIWVAAHAMRSFSIPLMLATRGNEVLASQIWRVWQRGFIPEAAAYGVILTVVLIPLTLLMRRYMIRIGGGIGR